MSILKYKQPLLFGADRMLEGFLREDDLCSTIQKEVVPNIKLEDFEDMYKGGGRPPVNPKVLLVVLVLQYIERLSDRAAAHNLRFRIDWIIALGLEIEFEGIHPTTLVKFRDRLLDNDKASMAFDLVIKHLIEQGLVKQGASHRIDSTHIVAKVRELGRREIFHETLRLFCKDIEVFDEIPKPLAELRDYYQDEISIRGISEPQKKRYAREAGAAMKVFIDWIDKDPELADLESFKVMKKVFEQNFDINDPDPEGPKPFKIATGKNHISSPHEPEARFGNKGSTKWLGYKAQFAETVGEGAYNVNFITYVDINDTTDHDGASIPAYVAELEKNNITPSEILGDTHYNSEKNIGKLLDQGIDLCGPVAPDSKKPKPENEGFEVDFDKKEATCPKGKRSEKFTLVKNGPAYIRFSKSDCEQCPNKPTCSPNFRGREFRQREPNLLNKRREEMTTIDYAEKMYRRNGIEGTISGMVRGLGLREARYRGKSKVRLQIKFSGAAENIKRLHRKRRMLVSSEQNRAA